MPLINVPLTGQSLDVTRNPINTNFSTINTAFAVNHVQYTDGSGNQGFHQFIQFPAGTPTGATNNGTPQVALYSKNGNTSGVPELYFQKNNLAADSGYAITEGLNATAGYARLPSGLLLKWGTATMTGSSATLTVNYGSVGPNFTLNGTQVLPFNIQITPYNAANTPVNDFDRIPWFTGFAALPATTFNVTDKNSGAITSFYWLLMGTGT